MAQLNFACYYCKQVVWDLSDYPPHTLLAIGEDELDRHMLSCRAVPEDRKTAAAERLRERGRDR